MKDLNKLSLEIYNTKYEDLTHNQVRVIHSMFMKSIECI